MSCDDPMKVITQRGLIEGVADRWEAAYFTKYGGWSPESLGKSKEQIHAELVALDKSVSSAADVAAVIGNDSWTHIYCDGCGKTDGPVVNWHRYGAEYPCDICIACVARMRDLLAEAGYRI